MKRSGTPERHGAALGDEHVVELAGLVKHSVAAVEWHFRTAARPQILSNASLADTDSLCLTMSVWGFLSLPEAVALGILGRQDQHRFMKGLHCRERGSFVDRYTVQKPGPRLLDPYPVPEGFAIQNDHEKEFEFTPEEPGP